jgi:micrococcal nuclease
MVIDAARNLPISSLKMLLAVSSMAILISLATSSAFAQEIRGVARVIDGDTIQVSNVRIRIHALHAPEMDEPGGVAAKAAMKEIVGSRPVTCRPVDRDRYGRTVADCRNAAGRDLAEAMISAGVARHCPRFGRSDLRGTPTNGLSLPAYCR